MKSVFLLQLESLCMCDVMIKVNRAELGACHSESFCQNIYGSLENLFFLFLSGQKAKPDCKRTEQIPRNVPLTNIYIQHKNSTGSENLDTPESAQILQI
jgi:hypothetical protein